MLVKIIGGHGGVAPGFRNTSYLIDGKLLIDAGSVASGLNVDEQARIDNILISHAHLDHMSELAFLADNCFGKKKVPFFVHATKITTDAISKHLMNDLIWPDFTKIPSAENPTVKYCQITPEVEVTIGNYKILPVRVNHPNEAVGFIIQKGDVTIALTQDSGPTDRIWELLHNYSNVRAIFTEVSFPNKLQNVANASSHHTPFTLKRELIKMPPRIPVFVGHLKPAFQAQLYEEIDALEEERITILGGDDTTFLF